MARRLTRGEIRMYKFTPPDEERPVLILTRESALGYLNTATVAPNSSTIRGVPSEVMLGPDDGMKHPCAVNLHNLATVEQHRLGRRVAELTPQRMREVCAALQFSFGCD